MTRVQPKPKRHTRPQPPRRHKAAYLIRQLAAGHATLADPTAPDAARRGARCLINRTVRTLARLEPIRVMRRGLDIDRLPVWLRPAAARSAS